MRSALSISLLSSVLLGASASPWDLEKRGCGNNCARAVIAGAFPNRPTAADCSSYLAVTVVPDTVTFYETATSSVTQQTVTTDFTTIVVPTTEVQTVTEGQTVTVPAPANGPNTLKKRNALPTYATACKSPEAYVEACGCIGVSAFTVTAPAPSTTISAEVTLTITDVTQTTATDFTTSTDLETATITVTDVVATVTAAPVVPPVQACLVALPPVCAALAGTNGLNLIPQMPLCLIALTSVATAPQVVTLAEACLGQIPTLFAQGQAIVDCLNPILCASVPT